MFIHIGLPKTGTTAIQNALSQNAQRLRRERSLNYPDFAVKQWPVALPFIGKDEFRPLENYILRGRGTREDAWRLSMAFFREFEQAASRYETHVISAEQLPLLRRKAVEDFRAYFVRLGLSTKVVVYVRHPAERLSSLISMQLLAGRAGLASFRSEDDVMPPLRTYADVFGRENLIVRRYGPAYFAGGDLVSDFMTAIGQAPLDNGPSERINEALSLPGVLVADQLFDAAPLTSGRRGYDRYLRRIVGPKFLASRAMVRDAMDVHRDALGYLEAEFGVRFDPVDLSAFPEEIPRSLSTADIASIAAVLNEQSLAIGELNVELDRERNHGLRSRVLAFLRGLRRGSIPPSQKADPPFSPLR